MYYTGLTWIRENGRLSYVDGNIQHVLGWTAEEIKTAPLTELMTGASFDKLKKTYLTGVPGSIAHHAMTLDMRHKDGHVVPMRLSVVCRWDKDGGLAEAWGSVRHTQRQREQDDLLAWWETADPAHLEAVIEIAGMYAAL